MNGSRIYYMLAGLVIGLMSSVVAAYEAPQRQIIAAAELSGLFHHAPDNPRINQGVYYTVLQQALTDSALNDQFEIIIMPMKRAKAGFISREFACYSPGMDTFDDPVERAQLGDVLGGITFNSAIVRVVSRTSDELVYRETDITRQDVLSMVRGTPMSHAMRRMAEAAGQLFNVRSETENLNMLINGRADHIMVFYPDVIFAYRSLGIEHHFPYAASFSPLVIGDGLICHSAFADAYASLQSVLETYRRDGTLHRLLGDYYLLDSEYMEIPAAH
ncbi:hypothetical protein LJ739_17935 [Aestuariibacter halophilus]|uniref:Solute-binding protein family 3/N-terminal domain-containing protein n=1 Tax=Fluctibacter halophilus TaxID=226011 RepID=A0ABS8GDF8_9ALTE|nr:hypothetical protein [Aestuariibacter halophilus]MCC2618141.1 hypothetical protein [Aestuariibacter halophilus]